MVIKENMQSAKRSFVVAIEKYLKKWQKQIDSLDISDQMLTNQDISGLIEDITELVELLAKQKLIIKYNKIEHWQKSIILVSQLIAKKQIIKSKN